MNRITYTFSSTTYNYYRPLLITLLFSSCKNVRTSLFAWARDKLLPCHLRCTFSEIFANAVKNNISTEFNKMNYNIYAIIHYFQHSQLRRGKSECFDFKQMLVIRYRIFI